ncbi:hypothetical protein [uncultured Tenacibaculum sp.]|uniref:hypothetical protein n=1 Tax=uncultured Tenacibaculum sp. TaxID=174713 RepID=UPI00262FD722|nr:hypothetical protein [uncultured Tenacibaculum sp.]
MQNTINLRSNLVVFGIPILMILSLVMLIKSSFFIPEISSFVVIDFLITIPLVYFLLIRKKAISNKTVFSAIMIGVVVASLVLPKDNQQLLSTIKVFLIPIVEIGLIVFVAIKARVVLKRIKATRNQSLDFFDVINDACREILPSKIAGIFASEIAMVYYGLFNWKKKELQGNQFSYHKDGMATSVILGFLLVVVIEMFVTHSMMKQGNVGGSFVLAILSGYTALQIIATLRSLAKRPIVIDKEKEELHLKFGILANGVIPFAKIDAIEMSTKEIPENSPIKFFSPIGRAGGHNILIHFKEEIRFNSFYGFTKKAQILALQIDKKELFVSRIREVIGESI